MLPSKEEALRLLEESHARNVGPWREHSLTAAHCAESIARRCGDMDAEKAYVLGLLHDIGRRFGVRHLGHVSDGYTYMLSLGYDEAARVCLTHSFDEDGMSSYIGRRDTTAEETAIIEQALSGIEFDEYDKLIRLCDAIAGAEGVMTIEDRMNDVKRRYGYYPQRKWDANLALKSYFERKMGMDLYAAVEKDTFKP